MKADLKITAFLANVPLFRDASQEELERIGEGTKVVHAPRGHTLFHKGDRSSGFHVVIYGQVKLGFTSTGGADKVVEIIGPGMTFGEAVMFLDKPCVVYAQAIADSMLLCVSQQAVFDEVSRNAGFAMTMLAGLSRRLHGLIADVEAYSTCSGAHRVIGYLLRDIDVQQDRRSSFDVHLPTSKNIIASRLNLTPQHFSRMLHELTEAGLIRVEGRTIRVLDVEGLRTYTV